MSVLTIRESVGFGKRGVVPVDQNNKRIMYNHVPVMDGSMIFTSSQRAKVEQCALSVSEDMFAKCIAAYEHIRQQGKKVQKVVSWTPDVDNGEAFFTFWFK